MKLEPLFDNIIIKPIAPVSITKGGLHLPENTYFKTRTGEVLAIGPGLYENGVRIPSSVGVGNIVLFTANTTPEIEFEGDKLLIINECDILAIVKG